MADVLKLRSKARQKVPSMDPDDIRNFIMDEEKLPDEVLMQFVAPWQYSISKSGRAGIDTDAADALDYDQDDDHIRRKLQKECWSLFRKNPQLNTAVRGSMGRLTGYGFGTWCHIPEIQDIIEEIEEDPRNRLYHYLPKFVARSIIEGELFLLVTCHTDGFIEVDFVDPSVVQGQMDYGIIFHPNKSLMPLIYNIQFDDENGKNREFQIPSIFLARYPELIKYAKESNHYKSSLLKGSRSKSKKFKKLGGFYRFIIGWDKGFMTKRNISYLRTTIEWLNYYVNLKKYEIDHKKSAGAYVWSITFEDMRAWRIWVSLSDADRVKTGILAPKTPGGTLLLPPGMKLDVKNPNLPKISEQDTDIQGMVSSGLNEPVDVTTGKSAGPFASVRASRGPMSDRISDEVEWLHRFLRFDFWGNIFYLRSIIAGMKPLYKVKRAVGFDDNKEPIFKNVKKRPEKLIEISFPVSEVDELEKRAKALLGVKHGSIIDTLGIPGAEVAKKMGFPQYMKMRLDCETEKETMPELISNVDAEAFQEEKEAEPSPKKIKRGDQDKPTLKKRKKAVKKEKK